MINKRTLSNSNLSGKSHTISTTELLSCIALVGLLTACGGGGGGGSDSVKFEELNIVLPPPTPDPEGILPRTRYALNNQCFAIKSVANDKYLSLNGANYQATADRTENAEAFFMKPASLGSYMLYNRDGELLSASTTPTLPGFESATVALANASDDEVFTVFTRGDTTTYPTAPAYDTEPTPEAVNSYRNFVDPNIESTEYTIQTSAGTVLGIDADGIVNFVAADDSDAQAFQFEPLSEGCSEFPEAQSNVNPSTPTYSGTTPDGRVLGMADAHVHISATTFLGRSEWGSPFHKYGVTHALDKCDEYHGINGTQDEVGLAFDPEGSAGGHPTDGWPTFTAWPARDSLTHEAIYWRWLERSWQAGLRIAVNELVDNQTLCELQRVASADPSIDCDPMNNATNQIGSMYAMQDYIDAQYGGRGEGFFRIVWDSAEARTIATEGKLAIVLGIEISNLFNCQITFNPGRSQDVAEESDSVISGGNTYACTTEEDDGNGNLPTNSILFQMHRLHDLGVRKIISIHEFDNAFGGNGIFMDFLNLGTRENSGGVPDIDINNPFAVIENLETPTGEFWTTYTCPEEGGLNTDGEPFSGYLFGEPGGELLTSYSTPGCLYTGFGGRPGGSTACYPQTRQCNARWMTPTGLYTYKKMMEMGFLFDIDHLEMEMKTQALELAESQPIAYPFVSTHGNFGGTSIDQAKRILLNGGFIYPSNGSTKGFLEDMADLLSAYDAAMTENQVPLAERPLFGFGFGTDTNGLSAQTAPRGNAEITANPIQYPFTLFAGNEFSLLEDFATVAGVEFDQPSVTPPNSSEKSRTWHQDEDGNAHHGMLADWVQEIQLEGNEEHIRHLYNSAEAFLRTWERTEQAHTAITSAGGAAGEASDILRNAPVPDSPSQPLF